MSHGDRVTSCPKASAVVGEGAGRADRGRSPTRARKFYAMQFHPEVVHTPDGAKLLRNFVHKVAGLTGDWTMARLPRARRSRRSARRSARAG